MNVYKSIINDILNAYKNNIIIRRRLYETDNTVIHVSVGKRTYIGNNFGNEQCVRDNMVVYRILTIDSIKSGIDMEKSYDMLCFCCGGEPTYFITAFKDLDVNLYTDKVEHDREWFTTYVRQNDLVEYVDKRHVYLFNKCNWFFKGNTDVALNIIFYHENDEEISPYDRDVLGVRHVRIYANVYIGGYVYSYLTIKQLWQIVKNLSSNEAKIIKKILLLMYKNPLKISKDDKQLLMTYVGNKCKFLFKPIYKNKVNGNYISFSRFGEVQSRRYYDDNYVTRLKIHYKKKDVKDISYMSLIRERLLKSTPDIITGHLNKVKINEKIVAVFERDKMLGIMLFDENNEYENIDLTMDDIRHWYDRGYIMEQVRTLQKRIQVTAKLNNQSFCTTIENLAINKRVV